MKRRMPAAPPATTGIRTTGTTTTGCGWGGRRTAKRPVGSSSRAARPAGNAVWPKACPKAALPRSGGEARPVPGRADPHPGPLPRREKEGEGVGRANSNSPAPYRSHGLVRGARLAGDEPTPVMLDRSNTEPSLQRGSHADFGATANENGPRMNAEDRGQHLNALCFSSAFTPAPPARTVSPPAGKVA